MVNYVVVLPEPWSKMEIINTIIMGNEQNSLLVISMQHQKFFLFLRFVFSLISNLFNVILNSMMISSWFWRCFGWRCVWQPNWELRLKIEMRLSFVCLFGSLSNWVLKSVRLNRICLSPAVWFFTVHFFQIPIWWKRRLV